MRGERVATMLIYLATGWVTIVAAYAPRSGYGQAAYVQFLEQMDAAVLQATPTRNQIVYAGDWNVRLRTDGEGRVGNWDK